LRKRDQRDYLRDIIVSIDDISDFIGGMSFDEFKRDKKTVNAVFMLMWIRTKSLWD